MAARRTCHDRRNAFWVGPGRPKGRTLPKQRRSFLFHSFFCAYKTRTCALKGTLNLVPRTFTLARVKVLGTRLRNSYTRFHAIRVIASATTTIVSGGGTSQAKVYLRYSRKVRNGTLFSSFREIYYFQTSQRRNVCTITGGSSMSLRCLVINRFISSHFQEQNALPVSAVFVVTSTQPFALAQPRKTKNDHPSFTPCGLTSKTDIAPAKVVENKF